MAVYTAPGLSVLFLFCFHPYTTTTSCDDPDDQKFDYKFYIDFVILPLLGVMY